MSCRIKICSNDEIYAVMDFIGKYWSEGHILSKSKELIDWQYYNKTYNHYNFAIAQDDNSHDIVGVIGYIPNYHYDESLINKKYIWFTTWKVRNDINVGGLGLRLLMYVNKYENTNNSGTVGNNNTVEPIYKALGYKTGALNHYYMINDYKSNFNLIKNYDKLNKDIHEYGLGTKQREFIRITDNYDNCIESLTTLKSNQFLCYKSLNFLKNRYINNPFYNYELYAIKVENEINSILVFRILKHENSKSMRIVDYYGDVTSIEYSYSLFQKLLRDADAEYIDFYNYGIDGNCFSNAGFSKRTGDEIIIPNYYEPFEMRNVDINFAYKIEDNERYLLFKGDCDQDRPNIINVKEEN